MINVAATSKRQLAPRQPAPTPPPEVRHAVRDLLVQSEAFAALPRDKQLQIAHNTAQIANYLAAPEGIPANTLRPAAIPASLVRGLAGPAPGDQFQQDSAAVNAIG